METLVYSSHGDLTVETESGKILKIMHYESEDNYLNNIEKFNIEEYVKFLWENFKITADKEVIDILEIGYWDTKGNYEYPSYRDQYYKSDSYYKTN